MSKTNQKMKPMPIDGMRMIKRYVQNRTDRIELLGFGLENNFLFIFLFFFFISHTNNIFINLFFIQGIALKNKPYSKTELNLSQAPLVCSGAQCHAQCLIIIIIKHFVEFDIESKNLD
jgi:hypothetical protein